MKGSNPYNKNQEIELVIDGMTDEGHGVGHKDGVAIFVPGTVVGETVLAHIIKVEKRYCIAKAISILVPSENRVVPRCPVYSACGGCTMQHMSYDEQLRRKRQIVADALERIGGLSGIEVLPVIGMDDPWRYRNKGSFPFGKTEKGTVFGFYANRSHRLVGLSDCPIQSEKILRAVKAVAEWANENRIPVYDEITGKGILRACMVRTSSDEKTMAVVVTKGSIPNVDQLLSKASFLDSIYHNRNDRNTNVLFGEQFRLLYGQPELKETLLGTDYMVSPESFLQVNHAQTQKLYQIALGYLNPKSDETIVDLYCGIGTISLQIAKHAKRVISVECVPKAIENARKNALMGGYDNTEFICGASEETVSNLLEKEGRIDAIVLDPPRKGCESQVIDAIVHSSIPRIIYISCNPSTLARDLKAFTAGAYFVSAVQPVDMFPQTAHVETVVLLSKGNISSQNVRVEFSLEDMDMSRFQQGATYEQIQDWVKEKYGFHVTHLNIAKTKRKCGIIERQNYNLPKSEDSRSPETPKEKEKAIIEAFRHFQMI